MSALLILVSLVGLILIGVPIAVSLGITAIGTYLVAGEPQLLTMLAQRMFSATTGFTLLAIPFFILAGNLMNTGGITERIFAFASDLVGHVRGGLGQVNVMASLVFSGMSGAAVADAAGLGQVELKAMQDRGYDRRFSAAITAASSTIGPVFPPSIPFVIYGSITGVSVVKLFIAGIVPGLLMAVALMVAVYIVARLRDYPREVRAGLRKLLSSFRRALLPLGTPAIIIGGILGGIFTPTEASVAACVYALVLGMLIYREIRPGDLPGILWLTAMHSVRLLFIIAAAGFFGYMLVHQRVPDALITGLTNFADTRTVAIALVVFILIVLGMFLEGIAVIVICVPLFMPLMNQYGVDPIQFGVIMIMCSMLGLLTPPVGMVLFAVASISKLRVGELVGELWPYLVGIFVVTLVTAFVPAVSTALPGLVWGP